MPVRTVFNDEHNNEMDFYLNDKGLLYIKIGNLSDEPMMDSHIVLDKEDVGTFIEMLKDMEKQME